MAWLAAAAPAAEAAGAASAGAGAGAAAGAGAGAAAGAGSVGAGMLPTVGGGSMVAQAAPSLLGQGSGLVNTVADTAAPSFSTNVMNGMANRVDPMKAFANGEYGQGLGSLAASSLMGGQKQQGQGQSPPPSAQQTPMNSMDRYNQLYRFRR